MLLSGFYILLTYMLASLPSGVAMAAIYADTDPRESGSGNIGATNVNRLLGRRLGAATLLGDVLKGLLPTALAGLVLPAPWFIGAVALAAFVGHCWSAYLGFRGGKGVATAAGALLAMSWPATLLCLGLWGLVVWRTHKVSLGSLLAALALPLLIYYFDPQYLVAALLLAAGVLLRHTANISRLLQGDEL